MQRSAKTKKVGGKKNQQTADRPWAGEQTEISSEPTREEIEQRAYEIYLARGGADGNDQDDWLQAERELRDGGGERKGSDE